MPRPSLLTTATKIATRADAVERVAAWKAEGLRVGFTNGCFDLIHPGHVSSLLAAGSRCDRLVVGLNADASVRRLKGPSRPIQSEMARAQVMAALAPVDLVVIFPESTPEGLIGAILPDMLFKGADYRMDQVAGASVVLASGGEVVLLDLLPGHSTTALAARSKG